ncbi:sulfotransferase [Sulfobacillus harzensis]|uniref:Sulfotransferase n=1 Tax=Sulfobacillus harzensis TaxID=2729629 RepID=A0A7Y0L363_9FIRM|nr:sulfotransferase [Sulfobacillus harzensis]
MDNHSPIFVTGMPRSGTTLLASLLNAHSQVAITPETDYFNRVWKPLARRGGLQNWPFVEEVLQSFFSKPSVKLMELPEEDLIARFHEKWQQGILTHADMLSEMLSLYARRRQKAVWGEKTPDHFMYVPVIKQVFPASRVVVIVRDPRDVHLSLEKLPWSRGNSLNHALQWRGYQSLARAYCLKYGFEFVQIRYEDLIADPEATLRYLCEKLELPFEPEMLNRYGQELLFDPNREPWKLGAARTIDPNNRNKWRQRMPAAEVALFSKICGKYLRKLHYDAPDPAPTMPGPIFPGLEWRSVIWWMRTNWRVKHGREPWMGQRISLK